MYKLSETEEWLCREIVDCAFKVHKELGPGLLERIYETCFCHELTKRDIAFKRQTDLSIHYDNLFFEESLRLDVLVKDLIVCELKSVEYLTGLWFAQVRSHLKLINKHVGFVINFNVPVIKEGIRRVCIE